MSDIRDSGDVERSARLVELLHEFKAQLAAVHTAEQELDRRRSEVRRVAELQAADIISDARREVSHVLARASRELLALNARLEAAGCGVVATPGPPAPDAAHQGRVAALAPAGSVPDRPTDRRIHEVLDQARTELDGLSQEARQLRSPIPEPRADATVTLPGITPANQPARLEPPRDEERPSRAWLALTSNRTLLIVAGLVCALAAGSVRAAWVARRDVPVPGAAAPAETQEAAGMPGEAEPDTAEKVAPAPAATTGEGPAMRSALREKPVSLRLEVRRPVWLRATIDGATETGRTYAAGDARRIEATREVSIRAGDAGALWISAVGQSATPFGRDGEVLTRRFTPRTPAEARRSALDIMDPAPVRPQPAPASPASPAVTPRPDVAPAGGEAASTAAAARRPREAESAAPAPAAPPSAAAPAETAAALEREILSRERQWFDAHYAGDPIGMATVSADRFTLEDTRDAAERFAAAGVAVTRTLEGVQLSSSGVGVVLSARMRERATINGETKESVTMLTEVWVRRDDGWKLTGVRIAAPARLR